MVSKEFTITNKIGLHMRPAKVFVSEMNKFSSTVSICFAGKAINGKGIMGIMVGMCGEATANTQLIPKLIEWGLDEFSVTPSSILQIGKTICENE